MVLLHKYDYLFDKFPYLKPENLAFIIDKSVLNCGTKIDDRVNNLSIAKRKLLYTAYHNKSMSDLKLRIQGIERVNDWIKIGDLMLEKNWKKSLTV